jgi:undecaprenyl-diphosphatase
MIDQLKDFDTTLFLFLNGQHNQVFDSIMWYISTKYLWIPLYIWFLWLLFIENRRHYWITLLAILLMLLISDQLCNLFKQSVMRLRPSNDPEISPFVHIVNDYRGGTYGFYSAHASNAFAVAIFMIRLVKRKMKLLVPVCITYAVLVSYSRIYLGVHFPFDVMTGAIAGSLIALSVSSFYKALIVKLDVKKKVQ